MNCVEKYFDFEKWAFWLAIVNVDLIAPQASYLCKVNIWLSVEVEKAAELFELLFWDTATSLLGVAQMWTHLANAKLTR